MRIIFVRCGTHPLPALPAAVTVVEASAVPTRQELQPLIDAARDILPDDPTPSLADIAKQPDVSHLGAPGPAPQPVPEPLRIIVAGDDAALSAVLTRLMRADVLWAEVAYVPAATTSPAARSWGIDLDNALPVALEGSVRPVPLIRSDKGTAVAGAATITEWDDTDITGEIIVDSHTLVRHSGTGNKSRAGVFGARLVPMLDAPGVAAVALTSSAAPERGRRGFGVGLFSRFRQPLEAGRVDPDTLATGRAVQAGGPNLKVTIDGVEAKRPVKRVVFYRHLRDLQAVRP